MSGASQRAIDRRGVSHWYTSAVDNQVESIVWCTSDGLVNYPAGVMGIRSGQTVEPEASEMGLDCGGLKLLCSSILLVTVRDAPRHLAAAIEHFRNMADRCVPLAGPVETFKKPDMV